jgi:hypothetical protein
MSDLERWNGTHEAKAVEWALASAGEKRTPEVAIRFSILSGRCEGDSITWHGWLTDKAFDRTIESLQYCGWEGDDLRKLEGLDTNEVSIVVELEEFTTAEGEVRVNPKVRWVNRAGGLAIKERMSDDEANAFAAKMRGRIVAMQKKRGTRSPAPREAAPTPHNDDDIPF